jgi:YidC/Oxa1 family membrane protein insertase
MTDQRNMIIAVMLSFIILVGYEYFFAKHDQPQPGVQTTETQSTDGKPAGADAGLTAPRAGSAAVIPVEEATTAGVPRAKILSKRLSGSLTLSGGRLDDLLLSDYHETVDKTSPPVRLLSPTGTEHPYFAEFGWVAAAGTSPTLPGPNTIWQASGTELTPGHPLTLTWDNGQGLTFRRTFSLDDDYMFSVTQTVENNSGAPVELAPYGRIARSDIPKSRTTYILHEGPVGVVDGVLKELDYDDLKDDGAQTFDSRGGWLGITDKYWLTALIPAQDEQITGGARHGMADGKDRYQTDVLYTTRMIPAGESISITSRLFAGAKEVDLIENYEDLLGIQKFDLSIDWGWFRFLTKPIFHALDFLKGVLGNFGLAILALTICIRLLFFPLANKQFTAMSKMKKLQPKMKELQERYKDDRAQQQQELMKLYKEEKVNPASSCLPLLIQIPVFFCLYKVLYITIEMRHAPFYGWIHDLSAPDPALWLTGFGLVPWDVPQFLAIGVWPVLMGLSMFLQQRLNPQATDPTQQKIFAFMPVIFTFMLAQFPVGLVIYYTWSNLLTMAQQWVILKRVERRQR